MRITVEDLSNCLDLRVGMDSVIPSSLYKVDGDVCRDIGVVNRVTDRVYEFCKINLVIQFIYFLIIFRMKEWGK